MKNSKKNYILIDYENVQPDAMEVLNEEHFNVIVFIGFTQTKIRFDIASALQQMGDRAEYVRISGNGSNALDFHIAFYIGLLAAQEPEACFHIVSNDTGFDPLIQHLKSKKILSCRSKDVTDISIVKPAESSHSSEWLAVIIADLQRRGSSKPRTVKTLNNTINSLFKKQLSDHELIEFITILEHKGLIAISGTKVSYTLPA